MRVVKEYPPNIDDIRLVLKPGKYTVYTYGDTLYAPHSTDIPDHLMAHEEVHAEQQRAMGIEEWWRNYLIYPAFRMHQELVAYRAQYKVLVEKYNREQRRQILDRISADMASPMYGNILGKKEAKALISNKI